MWPSSGAAAWPLQQRQRPHFGSTGRDRPLPPPRSAAQPARRGRHPELLQLTTGSGSGGGGGGGDGNAAGVHSRVSDGSVNAGTPAVAEPPRPEEVDERYRRADYSDVFQFEARQAFCRCIVGGEPRMKLAEAALHVTSEDDAVASHSTVRFPVDAWMERIERLVDQLASTHMRRAAAAAAAGAGLAAGGSRGADGDAAAAGAEAEAVLRVTERYLFEEVGFRMPEYGRSNLPANSLVDHAGVWEDARLGYLHETLIRRVGHPASLALLLGEVATRLLARGLLPCAAAIDTRSYMLLPRAVPIPTLTRELLLGSGITGSEGPSGGGSGGGAGVSLSGLNTCTSEVLVEMLRHLKRSYWPFPWDTGVDAAYPHAVGSHGGFRSAAKAAMGDDVSAALAAIGKVAAWRLERGIWTSPGAGDLRRARAACERLVLLAGDRYPEERRDLAVLLLHCGELGAARLELLTYLKAVVSEAGGGRPSSAAAAPSPADPRVGPGPLGLRGPDPLDLLLCRRLLEALGGVESGGAGGEAVLGGGAVLLGGRVEEEAGEPLGLEAALRAVPPWERSRPEGARTRYLPLTW